MLSPRWNGKTAPQTQSRQDPQTWYRLPALPNTRAQQRYKINHGAMHNQHDARHVMGCKYDVRMHEDALEPKGKMMEMASSWETKQDTG